MPELTISSLRLRSLPRRLLRAPSPFIEVHTQPASFPVSQTSIQERTTTANWPSFTFTFIVPTLCTPPSIGFIVRDAQNPHPPIGRLCLSIQTALVEGWFPLLRDPSTPSETTEVYVRIWCPDFCKSLPSHCNHLSSADTQRSPPIQQADGELRAVSSVPGCLFRCGQLNVSIVAEGVPLSVKGPFLIAQIDDQMLRAGEVQIDETATTPFNSVDHFSSDSRSMDDSSLSLEPSLSDGKQDSIDSTSGSPSSRRTKMGAVVKKKASKATKAVVKKAPMASSLSFLLDKASAYATAASLISAGGNRFTTDSPQQPKEANNGTENEVPNDQGSTADGLQAENEVKTELDASDELSPTAIGSITISDPAEETATSMHEDDEENVDNNPPIQTETSRSVDFGAFSFALLQGVAPKSLKLSIQDNKSVLPTPLSSVTEQKVSFPDLGQLRCACLEGCNTHIFEASLSDPGIYGSKITLKILIKHETWLPLSSCTNVTPRFQEIFSEPDDVISSFNAKFPQAKDLTYLFVGGLFTQHYPTYFEKNIKYLQEKLLLPRVQTIPIHTEGSIARNAKVIRDSIFKTCRGAKSVVLFGHSKGGVDVVSVLDMFPEAIPFIHGIVTFQAPFGGTFLIDFVSRSKLAVSAITSFIESVWKGDQDAFHDMSYSARLKLLGLHNSKLEQEAAGDGEDTVHDGMSSVHSCGNLKQLPFEVGDDCSEKLRVFSKVPCVSFGSYASFDVLGIRSAANAAGIASMAPAAQKIVQYTGYCCDGLVTAGDARVPFSDLIHLGDMMHTEPALYVQGTKYHPGKLTACGLTLLFEKISRSSDTPNL